jgi:hypothetical protein
MCDVLEFKEAWHRAYTPHWFSLSSCGNTPDNRVDPIYREYPSPMTARAAFEFSNVLSSMLYRIRLTIMDKDIVHLQSELKVMRNEPTEVGRFPS